MSKFLESENTVEVSVMYGIRVTSPEGKLVMREAVTEDKLIALAHECLGKLVAGTDMPNFYRGLALRCLTVADELRALRPRVEY